MDSNAFDDLIRGFFAGIIKFLYKFFSGAIDLMYDLASIDFGFDKYIDKIADKIFNILIIFMLFKVTISMLNYLVNPDNVTDSSKGIQNVIKRVVITIVMLISINPIFEFITDLQRDIVNSEVIASILGSTDQSNVLELKSPEGAIQYAYGVQMNSNCEEGKYIYTFSKGDHMSLLLLKPFIQPYNADEIAADKYESAISIMNEEGGYCGTFESDIRENELINVSGGDANNIKNGFRRSISGPNSAEGFMYKKYFAGEETTGNNTYIYDFNYFFALVSGLVGLLIVVSFCFDIVIRSCTLVLLKLIAPIPIISYVSPQGKSSEMLGTWLKKLGTVWVSLFIRIAVLSVAISLIGAACDSLSQSDSSMLIQIFVILGILMFARKLPKLLEELIPGLKLDGGLELNPFKRVSKDALGGNLALGAGAGLAAAGLSGATNFAHRTGSFIKNKGWNDKNGNLSLRSAASGLAKIGGSTIAGATRGGVNAFGRTSKDGKIFSGAWSGYQTSMYSKIQREDNYRKAGLEDASLFERAKFVAGSAVSDAARYVGVLNKGQKEYLRAAELDNEIKELEDKLKDDKLEFTRKKRITLEPYTEYSTYASKIKDKIDNDKAVKDAKKALEDAQASGDSVEIMRARTVLDNAESEAGNRLLRTDNEVRAYTRRLDEIRANCEALRHSDYNYIDADGNFAKGSIYNTKSSANVIEMDFAKQEKQFEARQTAIDAKKREEEYIRTHDENSIAKVQNATRMNKEVQPPGLKPSAAPMQSRITDSAQYSNLGNSGHGPHGGPGPHGHH